MNNNEPLMLTIKKLSKEWGRYLRKISLETGVPDSYRRIIMFLNHNPGSSQKMVAEFCQLTTAAVSQIIKEMQLEGYLIKEVDSADQRYFKLFLTEKSKNKIEIIKSKIDIADSFITQRIGVAQEKALVELLTDLSQTIKEEL